MKPIDEKLAKLANKAEVKVNDRPKEEKQAYDKGFVTGVLSIALEFELDKEEVASFLEERRVLTKAVELLESKRPHGKWKIKTFDEEAGIHRVIVIKKGSYFCTCCGKPKCQVYSDYCANCGADMREADDDL